MSSQFVIYKLAGEQYGIDIGAVESIIRMQEVSALPQAPEFVEGVINLRGDVIPVIDLRKLFELPLSEKIDDTRIIVVEIEEMYVGMIVDAVTEVLTLQDEDIEPPSTLIVGNVANFITGIAKVENQLVTIIDLRRVLQSEELLELAVLP